MSETPRSTQESFIARSERFAEEWVVPLEISRTLERELAAALERVKELEALNEELVSTKKFLLSEINALNKKIWD